MKIHRLVCFLEYSGFDLLVSNEDLKTFKDNNNLMNSDDHVPITAWLWLINYHYFERNYKQ